MQTVLIADVCATSEMQALVVKGDMLLADAVRQFANNHDLRGIFLTGENDLLTGVINKIDLLNWVSMQLNQLPAGEPLTVGQMRRLLNAKRLADLATVGSEEAAGDWTLRDTINGTDTDDATMEDLVLSQPYLLKSGETMGFAIFATIGGYQWYDTCGGSDTYSEGPLTLDIIDIRGADDGFNSSDNCRSFAGMVNYGVVAVATPTPTIPSLSVAGMILMTLMLGLFGLYRARKTI